MAVAKPQSTLTQGVLDDYSVIVHWKIPDFFSISDEDLSEEGFIEGPDFSFVECDWHLRAYPKGGKMAGYLSVCLCKDDQPFTLRTLSSYSIGIKTETGIAEERIGIERTFLEDELNWGWYDYLKLDDLQERRSELVPSDTLTIMCHMEHAEELLPSSEEVDADPGMLVDLKALSVDLEDLLNGDIKCDVTAKVQGKEFHAHRAVLVARSPVFDAIFEEDTAEAKTGVLTIPDCDPEFFGDFLDFLYTGKLRIASFRSALSLYVTAGKYEVQQLKSFCADCMRQNMKSENVSDVAVLADRFGDDELQSSAQNFFNKNLHKVLQTPQWTAALKDDTRVATMLLTNAASVASKIS